MELELRKIIDDKAALREVGLLYRSAFPLAERAPYALLRKRAVCDYVDLWGIYKENVFLGFAYVVRGERIAYLYYFALKKEHRGKGYGSKTLAQLKEKYEHFTFFLALEQLDEKSKNYSIRVRRHNFYLRAGLKDISDKVKEGSETFGLMGTDERLCAKDYMDLMERYMGRFYIRIIDIKYIEA